MSVARSLRVRHTWDGQRVGDAEAVNVRLGVSAGCLVITVDAPAHGDPAPPHAPGSTPALWEHEVVEVMLLGDDDRYIEVELGPGGHYLVLSLHGRRNVERQGMAIDYRVERRGSRWAGIARLPAAWLPPGLDRVNAYAIHGVGPARRYLAWRPPRGPRPDFHRLSAFGRVTDLAVADSA